MFNSGAVLLRHRFEDVQTWCVASIGSKPNVRPTRVKHTTISFVAEMLKAGQHPSGDECANVLSGSALATSHD
jgi:hypothetical protein